MSRRESRLEVPIGVPASVNNKHPEDPDLARVLQKLRPFQREAYDFATSSCGNPESLLGHGRLLLCDEMGLGKSVTSLAIMMHYRKEWPLLILCPASLRYTWPVEIEKFIPSLPPSAIYVVQGFDDADFFENPSKRQKIQIVIVTYSLLQNRSAAAQVLLKQFQFQCIIVDESHNLKQKTSQRTQIALPLLESAKRLILLSGTPALARPVELWTQVYAIAPHLFGSYPIYTKRYCNARKGRFGWDVTGLSNADELHQKLKQIMIRRLKVDVLHELPAKQRSMIPIPISNKSKRKECEDLIRQLKETRQSVHDLLSEGDIEMSGTKHWEARRLLMEAYQASGVAKAESVCDYLLEWLRGSDGHQKILIFAHHKVVLDTIEVAVAKELKGAGHIRIDGTVNAHERAVRVRKFQSSKQVRVAILSVTAAGVGLTLTAASSVMFAELHWTPGVLAQAEDRCHRIGQPNAVNVMYLVCEDPTLSVDMQLWDMLGRKVNNLGRVVDGERNTSLDAKRDIDSLTSQGERMSGQDELQSFFAETAIHHQRDQNKQSKLPVKGTILSFFAKQQQQQQVPQPGSNDQISIPSEKESTTTSDALSATALGDTIVEWACHACTFINTRKRSKGIRLECEICGATHQGNEVGDFGTLPSSSTPSTQTTSNLVTPRREPRDNVRRRQESEVKSLVGDEEHFEDSVVSSFSRTTFPNQSNVIVIDDALPIQSSPSETIAPPNKRMKTERRKSGSTVCEAITLTEKCDSSPVLFSVSKNSGRVMIHYEKNKEPSLVSFDLEEILCREVFDQLLETKLDRKRTGTNSAVSSPSISLKFDNSAIDKVVGALDRRKLRPLTSTSDVVAEIKSFVTQYVSLREIEKKRIKDSGEVFSSLHLRRELLPWMHGSLSGTSTERYEGGAKEHARSRMEQGTASEKDLAVLDGQLCAYCAGELGTASRRRNGGNGGGGGGDVISTYCSNECAETGRLKRGGRYASNQIRLQVFALEGGVCRLCGIDAHALYTRIASLAPAERLNALCNTHWKLPKSSKALERLLQHPKEGDFWQADHIQAVAEGGGGCELENLRTLCTPCHTAETEKLRGRLKLVGSIRPPEEVNTTSLVSASSSAMRQTDIRSMFSQTSARK